MKSYWILFLLVVSCKPASPDFEYEVLDSRGIVIKNFKPQTRDEFTKVLIAVNDTLKMDTLYVSLFGEDVSRMNPEFKKKYYRGYLGRMDLASYQNDTLRALKNLRIGFGYLTGKTFTKNDDWDEKVLNNKFFLQE